MYFMQMIMKEVKTMTFDEAIKYANENSFVEEMLSDVVELEDVIEILEKLKKEYAPTVEMTKRQYAFITSEYERENVVDAVANLTVDDILKENFHAKFWEPLTQREVVQAWLHPETIKIKE